MIYLKAFAKLLGVWFAYMLIAAGVTVYFDLGETVGFWIGFAGGALSWVTAYFLGFFDEVRNAN